MSRMTKTNAREILFKICDQFRKVTGESIGITYSWSGSLNILGSDKFREIITQDQEEVWRSLTFHSNNPPVTKPFADREMFNLLHNSENCNKDQLRKLISWATQKSVGRSRNIWRMILINLLESWWPEEIPFVCISKKTKENIITKSKLLIIIEAYKLSLDLTNAKHEIITSTPVKRTANTRISSPFIKKEKIEDSLSSNEFFGGLLDTPEKLPILPKLQEHNSLASIPTIAKPSNIAERPTTNTPKGYIASTPKRSRTNSQSPSLRKKHRLSVHEIDDIVSISTADNSFFVSPYPDNFSKNTKQQLDHSNKTNRCNNSNAKILWKSDKAICLLELSQPNKWLSDITIKSFCTLLKHSYPHVNGLQDTIFSQKLKTFKKAVRNIPSIQLHNSANNHWVCSKYDGKGGVYLYDSLYLRSTSGDLDTQLAYLYGDNSQQLLLTIPSIQQQKSSSECGLYALAVATALAAGIDPAAQSWSESLTV